MNQCPECKVQHVVANGHGLDCSYAGLDQDLINRGHTHTTKLRTIKADGTPVQGDKCVNIDHHETTFVVTLRSLSGISAMELVEYLQRKYEVTHISHPDHLMVAR